eukprot:4824779-Heterocapsa_arctica.AAC.1
MGGGPLGEAPGHDDLRGGHGGGHRVPGPASQPHVLRRRGRQRGHGTFAAPAAPAGSVRRRRGLRHLRVRLRGGPEEFVLPRL